MPTSARHWRAPWRWRAPRGRGSREALPTCLVAPREAGRTDGRRRGRTSREQQSGAPRKQHGSGVGGNRASSMVRACRARNARAIHGPGTRRRARVADCRCPVRSILFAVRRTALTASSAAACAVIGCVYGPRSAWSDTTPSCSCNQAASYTSSFPTDCVAGATLRAPEPAMTDSVSTCSTNHASQGLVQPAGRPAQAAAGGAPPGTGSRSGPRTCCRVPDVADRAGSVAEREIEIPGRCATLRQWRVTRSTARVASRRCWQTRRASIQVRGRLARGQPQAQHRGSAAFYNKEAGVKRLCTRPAPGSGAARSRSPGAVRT